MAKSAGGVPRLADLTGAGYHPLVLGEYAGHYNTHRRAAPDQSCVTSALSGSCPASRAWRLARHFDNPALINSPTTTSMIT
jgi:hypothetical protein